LNFIDKSGLPLDISKKVHHKFYKTFNATDVIKDADIMLCGTAKLRIPPHIKYVVSNMTNTDHLTFGSPDLMTAKIVNLNGCDLKNVTSTAEHTFHLLMNVMKRESRGEAPGVKLKGKTIGIIGMGRVGRQVKDIAQAFGMYPTWFDQTFNTNMYLHM